MARYARRLQRIGSSILVSLPKDWITQNKLQKGTTVLLEVGNDNTMTVYPSGSEQEEAKDVVIPYPSPYAEAIVNEITGAYLLGYDLIRLKGSSPISYDDREKIKEMIGKMVGLEIVDEDTSNITAQFLLDTTTLDPEKILFRMSSIVSGMYRDTLASLTSRDPNTVKMIARRDDEVDRQYFLLVRLIRSAVMDQRLASKLNLSNIEILDYRIAANLFESAGDSIVELAKAVTDAGQLKRPDELVKAGKMIEAIQDTAVRAFTKKNRADSIKTIKQYAKLRETLDAAKQSAPANILSIIYTMDKIARCWVDVVDLVKPIPAR